MNKAFVFFSLIIITIICIAIYMYNGAIPIINTMCQANAKYLALDATNKAVSENIKNTDYDDLVNLKQNSSGKIVSINANVMELNRLSTEISSSISNKLQNIENKYIKIPIASIFNLNIFSGFGPKISLKVIPIGNVTAKFKSEFQQAGINQIRHRIFIEITTKVGLIAPFYTSSQEYVNDITVAETVIVGDTPTTYYNVTGLEDLNKKDSLEVVQ
ncbi:MAG: sporulation protein YunB [Clostridia bacterium]